MDYIKESNEEVTLSTGGELYWIKNIFKDFVISIATDIEFREKV